MIIAWPMSSPTQIIDPDPEIKKLSNNLSSGDLILNENGEYVKICDIQIEYLEDTISVYNLRIKNNNNYFANGYLVHNTMV